MYCGMFVLFSLCYDLGAFLFLNKKKQVESPKNDVHRYAFLHLVGIFFRFGFSVQQRVHISGMLADTKTEDDSVI